MTNGLYDRWVNRPVFGIGMPRLGASRRLVASGPMAIGGETVHSLVPVAYCGACAVVEADGSRKVVAVLPGYAEAQRLAMYAITPDGGFGSVEIEPSDSKPTHRTFYEWLESPGLEVGW